MNSGRTCPSAFRAKSGHRGGVTLVELTTALVIGGVVMMVAWATWEMGWRETYRARDTADAHRLTYNVLQRIELDVMRGSVLAVPDPSYPALDSMLVSIPSGNTTIRRAFRRSGNQLIIDLKDEGKAPFAAFDGVTELKFQILDAPTNSQVQITCTCADGGRSVQMRTVARKRN